VRLRGFKDGARWFTTLEAIRQFQDECTQRAGAPPIQNDEGKADARQLLRELGFNA